MQCPQWKQQQKHTTQFSFCKGGLSGPQHWTLIHYRSVSTHFSHTPVLFLWQPMSLYGYTSECDYNTNRQIYFGHLMFALVWKWDLKIDQVCPVDWARPYSSVHTAGSVLTDMSEWVSALTRHCGNETSPSWKGCNLKYSQLMANARGFIFKNWAMRLAATGQWPCLHDNWPLSVGASKSPHYYNSSMLKCTPLQHIKILNSVKTEFQVTRVYIYVPIPGRCGHFILRLICL